MKRPKIDAVKMRRLFDEAHKIGAKEFGFSWLRANERAIECAIETGLDYSAPQIKALLSMVVLVTLRAAR